MKKFNFGSIALIIGILYILTYVLLFRFLDVKYLVNAYKSFNYLMILIWLFSSFSFIFNSEDSKSLRFTIIGLLLYLLPNLLLIFHFNLLLFNKF